MCKLSSWFSLEGTWKWNKALRGVHYQELMDFLEAMVQASKPSINS